jgi:hypothetical protein
MKSKMLGLAFVGVFALLSFANFTVSSGKGGSDTSLLQLGTTAKAESELCVNAYSECWIFSCWYVTFCNGCTPVRVDDVSATGTCN